jgi:predicted amidohydrolase YtcJ
MVEQPSRQGSYVLAGKVSDIGAPGRQASCVLVSDGRIMAVGGTELIEAAGHDETPVYDLGERLIAPGFVDAHAHFELSALAFDTTVDCRFPHCQTIDDVLDALRDGVRSRVVDGWLVGQANLFWDSKLEERRYPTRLELDTVSTDIAIVVRAGGHASVLNSKAYELSGIERFDGHPGTTGRGMVERDEQGSPTGLIAELDNFLPLPQAGREDLKRAIERGGHELYTRFGVTTVGEISESLQGLECMDELIREERLPLRVETYLWAPGTMQFDEALRWQEHLSLQSAAARMAVRGVKVFSDGGYTASGAALFTPYEDAFAKGPDWLGAMNMEKGELRDAISRTRHAGLQLAVHANGERAQATVVRAALDADQVPGAPAVRVEHAGNVVTQTSTPHELKRAQVQIVPQPTFLYIGFGDFLPDYMGPIARRGRFPFKTLMDEGWSLAAGSDVHLGADPRQTNPLFGIWCCMGRETFLGTVVEPEERLSFHQAMRMHTLDAAAALGRDGDLGSLEVGKRADICILRQDPSTVAVAEIPDIEVDFVLLDGELVFTHETATAIEATKRQHVDLPMPRA